MDFFFSFFFTCFYLFVFGLLGMFLFKNNILIVLMSIELILFSINLNFIFFSLYLDDFIGQIFSLFIITVAAAESAIGLALLIVYYRIKGIIAIDFIKNLKG
jgi:NADH-quinone oxidoreductase subunit K